MPFRICLEELIIKNRMSRIGQDNKFAYPADRAHPVFLYFRFESASKAHYFLIETAEKDANTQKDLKN